MHWTCSYTEFNVCVPQANCVFSYCILCQLGFATNSIFGMWCLTAQRAREDGKSSHCAQGVLPRECLWPSYLHEYGPL